MKTVDMTPSWKAVVSMCVEVLQNPRTDKESADACREELMRLAGAMDDHLEAVKKYNERVSTIGEIVEEERQKGRLI